MQTLKYSKSKIDRAGRMLVSGEVTMYENDHEANIVFDWWRETHLKPLTEVTMKLIEWLVEFDSSIIVNQRLKRKPQVIKKLKRKNSMRLSQMRDIGGCRAVFESNSKLEEALEVIVQQAKKTNFFTVDDKNIIDYRRDGREESGYRALHIIVNRDNHMIEIQLRTKIQHKWAETIEQTSVLCGKSLKEGEGPEELIEYFKVTSDAFAEVDYGKRPPIDLIKKVVEFDEKVESVIQFNADVLVGGQAGNLNLLKAMKGKELTRRERIKNWVLIFDWKNGHFVRWSEVTQDAERASKEYSDFEKEYRYEDGFEVVLIGSSAVETIQNTHSHYFGVESFEDILHSIYEMVITDRGGLSYDAFIVLSKLHSHGHWKNNSVSFNTIQNHYCRHIKVDEGLSELKEKGLVIYTSMSAPICLVQSKKREIENIIKND